MMDDYKKQKLIEDINRVGEQLSSIAVNDIPRLQERIFVNVFLPLFAGDENRIYNATFETWISFAGSAYTNVDVIDVGGNVLFTVPPLFDRAVINPVNEFNTSIAHVVTTAGQYARIHPKQGSRYLDSELTRRATIMKIPANILKNLEIWNSIFKRYNRPEIMELDQTSETSISKIQPTDEFEPL